MGKKSSTTQSSMKICKHEKKQQLNSLIKILRPKVYITDSSNFKNLVQELTGNGIYSPVEYLSPPPPSTSPPTWEVAYHHQYGYHDHQENFSFDSSSCFATPLEGSPESSLTGSLNSEIERQKVDFYKDLEAMLMEMETGTDYDYGMLKQDDQVCFYDYDYDLSTLI